MDGLDNDVLIIGAGPVGLTLANELAKRGVRVRIVDKANAIREVSKAMILHVRTQEALDKVGIMPHVVAEGEPLREVSVRAYGKHIGSWHLDDLDSPHPHPIMLGQNRTQHLLLDHLNEQGVEVEWNTEATSLQINEKGATITLQHIGTPSVATEDPKAKEETIRVGYVVGCEGSNSLVRKTLGLTFEGERYTGEQFIQADCNIKWTLPRGRSYLWLTEDGYMMLIEMPDNVVQIFISLPDASIVGQQTATQSQGAVEDTSATPTLEEIHHHFVRLTGIECELSNPIWLARYRTSHRYANQFSSGRAFVAGDAGHVHVPIGGQGMNTGIQDAFNLGWKLAGVINGIYQPDILKTYHIERHPVAESLIHGTDIAYRGVLHPSEFQQHAARQFGPFLIRQEGVQRTVRNILEELNITYPNTPLNMDRGGSTGPRPGERILDAPLIRWSDLANVSLFDVVRNVEWTLLLFAGRGREADYGTLSDLAIRIQKRYAPGISTHIIAPETSRPDGVSDTVSLLLDGETHLHEKYGVSQPIIYLLRPDQCVAFRSALQDTDKLDKYLQRVFAL